VTVGSASRRLGALLAGAGLLLGAAPALAQAAGPGADPEEAAALELLDSAARASRTLTYSGTQYVAAWRERSATSSLVEVSHAPAAGTTVTAVPTAVSSRDDPAAALVTAGFDARLLHALGEQYALRVVGEGRCSGRPAWVVEAARPGVSGPEAVAGRFWIDRGSGLMLRREVLDEQGRQVRSSAFVDLSVDGTGVPPSAGVRPAGAALGAAVDSAVPSAASQLVRLRAEGWPVSASLPGGFELFDATVTDSPAGRVVRLAYSDGLSNTSLFGQVGALGDQPPAGFESRTVAGNAVWSRNGTPQRVVFAGGGRVWTLVSDAPSAAVAAAVASLPHSEPPGRGLVARLSRGLERLAGLLNPFS